MTTTTTNLPSLKPYVVAVIINVIYDFQLSEKMDKKGVTLFYRCETMSEGDYVTYLESDSLSIQELVFELHTNDTHMQCIVIGTVERALQNAR